MNHRERFLYDTLRDRGFSPTQADFLVDWTRDGCSNKDLAARRFRSQQAIKLHFYNIGQILGLRGKGKVRPGILLYCASILAQAPPAPPPIPNPPQEPKLQPKPELALPAGIGISRG
jgi:hypothetical protein